MNPLNFLGAMALAQENYKISCVNPLTLENYKGQILDVREKSEIDVAKCNDNAVESSVDEYKEGLNKLNKNKELLVVCQKGPRSYEVAKYAIHIGFQNVKYLGGGMQLAKQMLDKE
jgi:rhodanese-related sulfurtransferase